MIKWCLRGVCLWMIGGTQLALALPPPEEVPEEVLRTEIIPQGRSPLNGERLSAAEYAELQARISESPYAPELDPQVEKLIFLLNLRKLLETLNPF